MNTNARAGPSTGLRRTAARTASSSVPTAATSTSRSSVQATSTTSRPALRAPSRPPSRPPSRTASTTSNGTAASLTAGTQLGLKRKTRTASGDVDKDTSKRPTLSSAFAAHMSQGATQRQLLAAEARVSELENELRGRDARIIQLEADLRTIVEKEETERTARESAEKELTTISKERGREVSELKKQLSELIVDQEEMHDDFERLLRDANVETERLKGELEVKTNEVEFLQNQRDDAEAHARERDERIRELEAIVEEIGESGLVGELESLSEEEEAVGAMGGEELVEELVLPQSTEEAEEAVKKAQTELEDEDEGRRSKSSEIVVSHESGTPNANIQVSSEEDSDIDADGEIDEDESMSAEYSVPAPVSGSMELATGTPPETAESLKPGRFTSTPSSPHSQGSDELVSDHSSDESEPPIEEILPDPGAPPPYTVSSPTVSPPPILAREGDAMSIASSRPSPTPAHSSPASEIVMPTTPVRRAASASTISVVSTPVSQRSVSIASMAPSTSSPRRPDPLAHVRQRLSPSPGARSSASQLGSTPSRRRLSAKRLSAISSSISAMATRSASVARERAHDTAVIRSELTKQHAHLAQLEAERARLASELARVKERASGAEILREEIRGLRREAEAADTLRRQVAELEEGQKELAKKEEEWRLRAQKAEAKAGQAENGDEDTIGSPARVAQQLSSLRRSHAALLDEAGQLKAMLRSREVEIEEARSSLERAIVERDEVTQTAVTSREAAMRSEREHALAVKEITFLKSLIASYKSEEQFMAEEDAQTDIKPETKSDSGKDVTQLEALLEEYKSTNDSLRQEISRLARVGAGAAGKAQEEWDQLSQRNAELEETLKNARTEANAHAERVEVLEQQLFELGGEIGAGRQVPPKTRVLSLRENPAQAWADARKEVLDGLKAENEALLARITDLEAQGPAPTATPFAPESASERSNAATVPRASYDVLTAEANDLRRDLAAREKRLLRLQQVFQAKSEEFKDALAALLGLKVAFYPNGQVRITSVYDLRAAFVFQPAGKTKGGKNGGSDGGSPPSGEDGARMQLIAAGEGVPEELDGLVNMWIREEMSIPCFLASVTLECYDRWKREGSNQ